MRPDFNYRLSFNLPPAIPEFKNFIAITPNLHLLHEIHDFASAYFGKSLQRRRKPTTELALSLNSFHCKLKWRQYECEYVFSNFEKKLYARVSKNDDWRYGICGFNKFLLSVGLCIGALLIWGIVIHHPINPCKIGLMFFQFSLFLTGLFFKYINNLQLSAF